MIQEGYSQASMLRSDTATRRKHARRTYGLRFGIIRS